MQGQNIETKAMAQSKSIEESIAIEVSQPFVDGGDCDTEHVDLEGAENDVVIVKGATASVVVRLYKDEDSDEAIPEYEKEQWCLQAASAASIPSPEVLQIGTCRGRAYMVLTWIPGETSRHSNFETRSVYRHLGKYAKIVHSIEVDSQGQRHFEASPRLPHPESAR